MSRYTGPKFKLCRREGVNLFGPDQYSPKNRRGAPGQHGANMVRLSEYGKLLRNKQVLKRTYQMGEKQFRKLVMFTTKQYAKNKQQNHDLVLYQFLERRLDNVILRAGFANTIFQARQMITHGHFLVNGHKHNIPSYFVNPNDVITLRDKMHSSDLYSDIRGDKSHVRLAVDDAKFEIKVLDMPSAPQVSEDGKVGSVDILKVIEFYARA